MSIETPIEAAIRIRGSEAKLAAAAGYSQVAINKAKRTMAAGGRITADLAVAIERATAGAVPRHQLRPDLWPEPAAAL